MERGRIVQRMLCAALLATAASSQTFATNEDRSGLFLEVDYLFWKAEQDAMSYAIQIPGGGVPPGAFFTGRQFNVIDQSFRGQSGVKVLGGVSLCGCADTRFGWTHLETCAASSVEERSGVLTIGAFIGQNDIVGSKATSKWNVSFNTLDWEFGACWDLCDDVAVRPHVGLKWGRINQSRLVTYSGFVNPDTSYAINEVNNFSGTGPRVGADAAWYFYEDFSLIAAASGSLLYGKFNVHDDYTNKNTGVTGLPENQTIRICTKALVPVAQAFLGLNWEPCSWECIDLNIGVGYEVQYWWDQWRSIPSIIGQVATSPASGDFTTHGLTLKFGIEF